MEEIIISSLVTIIGFVISFLGIKRELKNSLHIQQNEFMLQKLDDIVEMIEDSILYTLDEISHNRTEHSGFELNRKLDLIYKKILPYGSREDIMIIETICSAAYSWEIVKEQKPNYQSYNMFFIANMYLLMCQMKMEMTGTIVNPEAFFRVKFPEYDNYRYVFMNIVNDTVNELDLCRKFIIK